MTDDTDKNQKSGIAGRIRRLFTPENGCSCCCGDVKIVPKKTGEKKEEADDGGRADDPDRGRTG